MTVIRLPQLAWHGHAELELPLPSGWEVEMGFMSGHNRPALTAAQVRAGVTEDLIGIPPIPELARGKKEVVIIFDDMTRVTRAAEIVPYLLAELAAAGIPDDRVRFIAALGCHGAMNRVDFTKKLGEETLARFPVYNHNPYANCVYVGTTKTFGTRVCINEEVMRCDFKIAIGSVVPHPRTGFGGGAKIILPGVTSFDTIKHNHHMFYETATRDPSCMGMGIFDNNPGRLDIEEAGEMAGLDVLINCLVNMRGETAAVYAGAPQPTYAAAVDAARQHYLTPAVKDRDIVIANTFAKSNEAWLGLPITFPALKQEGGDIVIIGNNPEGQVTHYLLGPFGETIWGPLRRERKIPPHVRTLIFYTEYPDLAGRTWFGGREKALFRHKWDEVLDVLLRNNGNRARVVVYPNAEIQYAQR